MADDEQGFTFVDKRRAAAEAPVVQPAPAEPAPAVMEQPSPTTAQDDDTEFDTAGSEQGPTDIYNVLGYCVSILASEAWQKLGLIADQSTGEAALDIAQAKVAIDAAGDLAARLENAPEASVPEALKRDLRTLMQDLRLNYVSQQGQTL